MARRLRQYANGSSEVTIWWKDGGWTGGDLPPGEACATVESDHDADVTLFGKCPAREQYQLGACF